MTPMTLIRIVCSTSAVLSGSTPGWAYPKPAFATMTSIGPRLVCQRFERGSEERDDHRHRRRRQRTVPPEETILAAVVARDRGGGERSGRAPIAGRSELYGEGAADAARGSGDDGNRASQMVPRCHDCSLLSPRREVLLSETLRMTRAARHRA